MTTLQNSVQKCEDLTSFEEIFSTCYSHGLESIYKLESVDLKSVRKLAEVPAPRPVLSQQEEWFEEQFHFDFGPLYRGWMVPFLTSEPIQVLLLTKPLEKTLLSWGVKSIGQLQKLDLQGLKLGQGHIEEVRQRVRAYMADKPVFKTRSIDFLSLVKCISADKDRCKAYVVLESLGLHEWMSLTPSEAIEVKRCVDKREWIEGMLPQLKRAAESYLSSIVDTWIKPWMYRREGIATQEEIEEFLLLQSADPIFAEKAVELFGDLSQVLLPLGGCFAASEEVRLEYHAIDQTLKSYFVNPSAKYLLNDLVPLILRELAEGWHFVTEEKVLRILRLSYHVFRQGNWYVQLQHI